MTKKLFMEKASRQPALRHGKGFYVPTAGYFAALPLFDGQRPPNRRSLAVYKFYKTP